MSYADQVAADERTAAEIKRLQAELTKVTSWLQLERKHHTEAEQKCVKLLAEKGRLRGALLELATAERTYREVHDLYGDGSREAGYAWDKLRQAGDHARAALNTDD